MESVFEKIIGDLREQNGEYFLESCIDFRIREVRKIPDRYLVIAYGFVKNLSLEELNKKLTKAGCEKLYARNFLEASLVFAFSRKMPYERWKELWEECGSAVKLMAEDDLLAQQKQITVASLREYVEKNSKADTGGLSTGQLTTYIEEDIRKLPDDAGQFKRFLEQNVQSFSTVREKTRYYFCKYLYYYIRQKINQYLSAVENGKGVKQALSELLILKGAAGLRQKKMEISAQREFLENAPVSFGNIYDAFNYFYFGYVSTDWMEVLLDYYGGNITMLPEKEKRRLAKSLRSYESRWKGMEDDEIINRKWKEMQEEERRLDEIYSLDGRERGYQRNRSGEKSIRNYIKGRVDVDRTTLICYLIFFGRNISVEQEQMISLDRINKILSKCGFPGLRKNEEFDRFIMEYMECAQPEDYLMEVVTQYAFQNRNFFLYHMYNESANNEEQFERLLKTD